MSSLPHPALNTLKGSMPTSIQALPGLNSLVSFFICWPCVQELFGPHPCLTYKQLKQLSEDMGQPHQRGAMQNLNRAEQAEK